MYCKCTLCQERREFLDRLQSVPIEHQEFFEELYDKYDNTTAMMDFYKKGTRSPEVM